MKMKYGAGLVLLLVVSTSSFCMEEDPSAQGNIMKKVTIVYPEKETTVSIEYITPKQYDCELAEFLNQDIAEGESSIVTPAGRSLPVKRQYDDDYSQEGSCQECLIKSCLCGACLIPPAITAFGVTYGVIAYEEKDYTEYTPPGARTSDAVVAALAGIITASMVTLCETAAVVGCSRWWKNRQGKAE